MELNTGAETLYVSLLVQLFTVDM